MIDEILTLYTELTGKQIPENLVPQYSAWARRAVAELESLLGWSLSGESHVNVIGTSKQECSCFDSSDLGDAPQKIGTYRIFNFDDRSPLVATDPFKKINAVYFCRVLPEHTLASESDADLINTVILKEISKFAPRFTNAKFGKFIEACNEMTVCQATCKRACTNCSALLIDANWLTFDDIKDMIGLLLCDYIDWMAADGPTTRGLQSESVDGHSVGYRDFGFVLPYQNPSNAAIIQTLVGPYGISNRKYIR